MLKYRKLCRAIVACVIVGLFVTTMPLPRAEAALVSSEQLATQQTVANERARLRDLVSRDEVQNELKAYGISAEEAQARVASLTDEEVMQVAGRLDQLPAGQSALGVIVGAAVLIFIVLLITDIVGLTKVFPFTRSVR